jgi:hypothetical protein
MASTTAHSKKSHFVVDGSNIATEGRNQPSLRQLNEAVLAFMEEHPQALITVVVDATFGHRIDKKEVKEFDAAVANNELVTPPAGAVGRGDAFVLSIAHKAKAGILSNDSFQEFHGQYDWLFDQGRLIGGKPVPHIGWVFVDRSPVRGPKSRQSVKDAKLAADGVVPDKGGRRRRGTSSGSPLANEPMPVPTAPPPGPAKVIAPAPAEVVADAVAAAAATPAGGKTGAVNELMPFLDFVERHPVGTSCTVVIESYSSHGAYARVDSVLVYLPLRLMDDPPPRSARSRLKLGEAVTVVVVGYAPERRSVDAALPHMSPAFVPPPAEPDKPAAAKRTRGAKKAGSAEPVDEKAAAKPAAKPAKASKSTKAATKAASKATAKAAAKTSEKTSEKAAAKPSEKTSEKTAEKTAKSSKATKAAAATKTTTEKATKKATKAAKATKADGAAKKPTKRASKQAAPSEAS